jgi:hypothetical protein
MKTMRFLNLVFNKYNSILSRLNTIKILLRVTKLTVRNVHVGGHFTDM